MPQAQSFCQVIWDLMVFVLSSKDTNAVDSATSGGLDLRSWERQCFLCVKVGGVASRLTLLHDANIETFR